MATALKNQKETFYVKNYPFVVEFDVTGKSALSAEFEINSIDGKPEEMFSDSVLRKIEEEIMIHCFKDREAEREFQAEMRGDEIRGN